MNADLFANEPPVRAFFGGGVSQLGKPFQGNPDFPAIGEILPGPLGSANTWRNFLPIQYGHEAFRGLHCRKRNICIPMLSV